MPRPITHGLLRFGYVAVLLLCGFSAAANPIELPLRPVAPEIRFLIGLALLLEVLCIVVWLRRFQTPRLFFVWLVGMHVVTYPAFLALVWLLQDMRPALAVGFGEALVVMVEGTIIYLLCHFLPVRPRRQGSPAASLLRCWTASLAGNALSLAALPVLMKGYELASRF